MSDTAELTHLDESILEDDCKCECPHTVTKCSYEVTHLHSSCAFSELVCWNAIKYVLNTPEWRNRLRASCSVCGRPLGVCWTIRPV